MFDKESMIMVVLEIIRNVKEGRGYVKNLNYDTKVNKKSKITRDGFYFFAVHHLLSFSPA